jgi:hypothetical protein
MFWDRVAFSFMGVHVVKKSSVCARTFPFQIRGFSKKKGVAPYWHFQKWGQIVLL